MTRSSLVVFAKVPRAGSVKTRLVPPLTADQAAALAAAFLDDLAERLPGAAHRLVLALPGSPTAADAEACARWTARGFALAAQEDGDLGARLARVIAREFAGDHGPVAVLGSDHPHVPLRAVRGALAAAGRGGAAWIRTADGGFALLALPRPIPELFREVPWSTAGVAGAVLANAAAAGVSLEDFGPTFDLDTAADLERLLAEPAHSRECPATWRLLSGFGPLRDARRGGHG